MPLRVIALFVAFVLLGYGFNTVEARRVLAQPSSEHQHAIAHAGEQATAHDGSVEHHHLDELPSQAHNDPPTETPELLPAPLNTSTPSVVMAQPRAFASVEAGPPFLAGPLRPPCGAALAG